MLVLKQKDEIEPLCPHCDQQIDEVWLRELKGVFGRRYLYFCSKCRKVLGVSHRKGFIMG